MATAQELLTRAEAAELLGTHPQNLYRWAKKGLLTEVRIDGTRFVRYRKSEVMALLEDGGEAA